MPTHGFTWLTHEIESAQAYHHTRIAALCDQILAVSLFGGMIHRCGAHVQHIPAWRDMPLLRSLQLNDRATDDLEHYTRGLVPE